MTTPQRSDLAAAAVMSKIAFTAQGRINRHTALLQKMIKRRQIIGGAVGAAGGGFLGTKSTESEAKRLHGRKATTGEKVVSGIGGAISGGYLGANVGGLTAMPRLVRGAKRQKRYVNHANRSAGGGRRGGYSAPKTPPKSNPGLSKVPKEHHRKIEAVAQHAKKTTGPEGENAKRRLEAMAKKHGFDHNEVLKHAAVNDVALQAVLRRCEG